MNTEIDAQLASALCQMAESNWPASQAALAERLQQAEALGDLRLNLFLLSVAAASGGHQQTANELWGRAQNAPLEASTTRYLDLRLDPRDPRQSVLLDLERAWWDFNNWNQATPVLTLETVDSIDWDFVLRSTLSGEYHELEARYAPNLQSQDNESPFLWNFFALAYLQAGDVRTHNEMHSNKPPIPDLVPEDLKRTLTEQQLTSALNAFESGQWLTQDGLFGTGMALTVERDTLSLDAWREQMENGFALIDLGQFSAASRSFEGLVGRTGDRTLTVLALNALALAFFKLGDYTQTESILTEFRSLSTDFPVTLESDLGKRFASWLASVGVTPEAGLFFSPFHSGPQSSGSLDGEDWAQDRTAQEDLDFDQILVSCVNELGAGETQLASRQLQQLEASQQGLSANELYLVSLLYLLIAVSNANHLAVQEFQTELQSRRGSAQFTEDRVSELSDTFKWAGFEKLANCLEQSENGCPPQLDPWTDLARSETSTVEPERPLNSEEF